MNSDGAMNCDGDSNAHAPTEALAQTSAASSYVDQLSQMQFELNHMSELFLSTVGELQRDAGPVSVNAEELVAPPSTSYNSDERAKGFAAELAQSFSNMQLLISKLPAAPGTEQEQLQRIRELQQADAQLKEELAQSKAVAEAKLRQLQDMYALLAQHEIARHMVAR